MLETQRYRDALKFHRLDTTFTGTVVLRDTLTHFHGLAVNTGSLATTVNVFSGPTVADEPVASTLSLVVVTFGYLGMPLPSGLAVEKTATGGDYTIIYE